MDGTLSLLSWGDTGWSDDLFWGIVTTLKVSISAYLIALVFGAVCAVGKQSSWRAVRLIAGVYTTVVRALPELLVILLLYFSIASGIERLVKGFGLADDTFQVSPFWAAVVALAFVSGAFMAEVLRAAYLAVPLGQIEAGLALGMHRGLILVRIVAPQMIRHAIPGMGNLWLEMTKESAIISVLGAFNDLLYVGYRAAAGTRQYIFFYGITAVLFLMITAVSVWAISRIERRFSRGYR